jgi:hypothetical protein
MHALRMHGCPPLYLGERRRFRHRGRAAGWPHVRSLYAIRVEYTGTLPQCAGNRDDLAAWWGGSMTDVVPFAVLSSDGQSFRLSAGAWSGTYRIDQLEGELAFYRRMRDRNGGKQARFYEATVRALEKMQVRA